jgi:hypothetical protein
MASIDASVMTPPDYMLDSSRPANGARIVPPPLNDTGADRASGEQTDLTENEIVVYHPVAMNSYGRKPQLTDDPRDGSG